MATICALPPKTTKPSPIPLVRESFDMPDFQSAEKQKLAELTEAIWQKLIAIEQLQEALEDDSEVTYRSVPPKRTFTVRMLCQFKGRGQPRKYPIDDE
ncbi:hypothetical protein [Oscillatoria acuminata]|uniref:Uncharacterized protein n=1 Tax=Oscillatoria acuminata PCC 6304 TaxID=56110 RepID=K9TGG7_9CYAN|nr:hypothetical protein [Oscillatoria acuminata]AFY81952.1 hypothetical protein Oscil6304_2323 [Oscillatoria acuminata PCC 6304]